MKSRTILVTEQDMERLKDLLGSASAIASKDWEHLRVLKEELDHAQIVSSDEIPKDVVTMNSRVRLKDLDSGRESIYVLVFPRDADVARDRISVLAPIGTAIIGYRTADVIVWPVPGGEKRLEVQEVLYQPEAAERAA
jgi:regulator of nucleoside diphosphate kinase